MGLYGVEGTHLNVTQSRMLRGKAADALVGKHQTMLSPEAALALVSARGLDLDTAGRRVRDDLGVGVDHLDRFRHSAGAAAAGHVFEMELHGKLLSGWGV
jgi:hypothetical protein